MFKTEPKSYHGCHPDIACALKRGEDIWCIRKHHPETKILVIAYVHGFEFPYRTMDNGVWDDLEPLETRTYRKKASEIISWLEDNGYISSWNGSWWKKECLGFHSEMYELCGELNDTNEYTWMPEWLEER